jgi:hypothetical protein
VASVAKFTSRKIDEMWYSFKLYSEGSYIGKEVMKLGDFAKLNVAGDFIRKGEEISYKGFKVGEKIAFGRNVGKA